eukprot:Skav210261  [mRNA]  locus=scaffold3363:7597:11482:+ [translate_table: standard]
MQDSPGIIDLPSDDGGPRSEELELAAGVPQEERPQDDLVVEGMKRPAAARSKHGRARRVWRNEECPGIGADRPCVFSTASSGKPARIQVCRGESHCPFCSKVAYDKAAGSSRPKIFQILKKLTPQHAETALKRIKGWYGKKVMLQYQKKLKVSNVPNEWNTLLKKRKLLRAPLDEQEEHDYAEAVRRDRRLVRRKVMCPEHKGKHGTMRQDQKEIEEVVRRFGPPADLADNDAGLPAPANSLARAVEDWCKMGSWGICETCGSVQPRPLQPAMLKKVPKPTITSKACTACQKGKYVPQLDDIPEPLRQLSPSVIAALRPLDLNTGPEMRAPYGYRMHPCMITFAWAPISVRDKIKALSRLEREAARVALRHLLESRESNYFTFYERHMKFLEKHGNNAPEQKRYSL